MTNSPSRNRRVRLAIFDIDGTIFRSSLLIELFNELVRSGIFPRRAAREVQRDYEAWLDRKGHYNDYLMKLISVHYRELKGQRVADVERTIDRLLDAQVHRVYRYTRELIATLRRKRYHLVAISNSQDALVQQFARRLGFNGAIGRVLEVAGGRYTGRVLTEDGTPLLRDRYLDKPTLLRHYLRDHHLSGDLARSTAVGDSEADLSILRRVGHPIAFNPSQSLARIARRHGWPIVVERKDVIYRIRDAQLIDHAEHQRVRIGHSSKR